MAYSKHLLLILLVKLCGSLNKETPSQPLNWSNLSSETTKILIPHSEVNNIVKSEPEYGDNGVMTDEIPEEKVSEEILQEVKYFRDYISYQSTLFFTLLALLVAFYWGDLYNIRSTFSKGPETKQYDPDMPLITDGETLFEPGDFIRPVEGIETYFLECLFCNSFTTHQAIRISSKHPISTEVWGKALRILATQTPVLQYRIGIKNFWFWFRRMDELVVNYVATEGDAMEEYKKSLSHTRFDPWKGPLWNVRTVRCTDFNSNNNGDQNYMLLFNVHHVITDATTNMMLCRETVRIVNSLQAGISVVPKLRPISRPIPNRIEFSLSQTIMKALIFFGRGFIHINRFHLKCPPLFTKHETRFIREDLTSEETQLFLSLCKIHKVTVNSTIAAVSSYAFRQAQKSIGFKQTYRTIPNQAVNLRKYCIPSQYTDGCYISIVTTPCKLSLSPGLNFWDEADCMQNFMNHAMKNHLALKYFYFIPWLLPVSLLSKLRFLILTRDQLDWHYVLTNMNRIDEHLPEAIGDDSCNIVDVIRSISGKVNHSPFAITFHTFRGKLMFSLDYYTNHVTEDYANEFFRQFISNIKELIKTGNVTV